MRKLSIVIPVYNEKKTIKKLLKRVEAVDLELSKEIIIVDDGSTDGTRDVLKKLEKNKYKIIFQKKNCGKGAALKKGFQAATGDIVMIQDADLEYEPNEYPRLLEPILSGDADVVYGSRFTGVGPHRVLFFWHSLANKFLTFFSNMLTDLTLTDMEVCYKVFKKEVLDSFKEKLQSKRFGIEPELTARITRGRWRIYEVGISYKGRTYDEGKKINWKDGFAAIWHILKYNIFSK